MVDKIIAYEAGELDNIGILELFSDLIKSGKAWSLQGRYSRQAKHFIDNKLISEEGIIDWEKYQELTSQRQKKD